MHVTWNNRKAEIDKDCAYYIDGEQEDITDDELERLFDWYEEEIAQERYEFAMMRFSESHKGD